MSISLTRILANAGIPVAMNALVPGSGMADMFIRNAGTGIARGIVNSPSGGPQRFGGPGSPEGAMPTRKFGATRETAGELKSEFKDWLVDPLQAKKEKREQARDTALAVRLGITGGEYSLTHRSAMSLIKKRTGDVQTNIMILQFRVQQFMARNLSAISSTLGVQRSKIGHEEPDPNRSWFGNLLSSIHKDLQENKVFSTLESVGKHFVNIGSILNPFTLGSRAKKGVKTFGEFMQRLAMGKEGFEMMKDPEKIYEKAGLKQDFQTKSLNLMKINNEYQKHQLNMLYNILGATKEMLGIFGGSYQNQKLDLTHDEFSGTLKTYSEQRQEEGMRYMRLETAAQTASRRSIGGRIGSLIGGARNIVYNIAEIARPSKASRRDLYVLDYLFNMPGFFDSKVRGASDDLDAFIDMYRGRNIDWYDKRNAQLADQFKFFIERAIEHPKPGYETQAHQLEQSWDLIRRQSRVQVSLASTHNTATDVANIFRKFTGYSAPNTDPLRGKRELAHQYETYTRFGGDRNMAGISVGSGGERAVNEYHNTGIIPAVLRSIPIIGALFGARQQMEISNLQTRYDTEMRGAHQGPDEDKVFGYGQGKLTGSRSRPQTFTYILEDFKDNAIQTLEAAALPFTLRKFGLDAEIQLYDFSDRFLTDLTGTSQKVSLIEALDDAKTSVTLHRIGLDAEIQLHDFFDGFLDNLIDRRQKVSIYNITKDACDKLEKLEFGTSVSGIGSGAITSLTSEVYDVNLVGVDDQKLLPKITPIINDFIGKLGVAWSILIDNNFKNVLVGPGGLVHKIFDKFKEWATDGKSETSVPTIPGDDTAQVQHQDAISILDAVKNQHNDAISLINAVSGIGSEIRSLGSNLPPQNTSSASLTKENIRDIIKETKANPLQIEMGNRHIQSLAQKFSIETENNPITTKEKTLPSAAATGGVFSGGNISDYSNQIVSQPTFFKYDELHEFAKGAGVMGEGDKPEGIFPLKRDVNGDLGIGAPSVIHALLVDTEGKPLQISLPLNQQKQEEKKDNFAPSKSESEKQKSYLYSGGSATSILRDFSLEKEIKPVFKSMFTGFGGIVSDIINKEIAEKYSSVISGINQSDASLEKSKTFDIREQRLNSLLSAAKKTSLIGKISNQTDKDNQIARSNISNLSIVDNASKDKITDTESNVGSIFNKTSTIRALLVDVNGNPVSFGLPTSRQKTEETKKGVYERPGQDLSISSTLQRNTGEGVLKPTNDIGGSLEKLADAVLSKDKEISEKKNKDTTKKIDENDNVKTAEERQKDIEDKQEKKEEEKKEQKQEANEEEKKSLLQRIADYINPESKFNKLREKLRKKKEDGGFGLGSLLDNIPGFVKKLGIGALAGFIYSQFSEQINKFLLDTVGSTFNKIVDYFEKNGPNMIDAVWKHFQEHPIFDSALFTLLFPGVVGTLISKIGLPLITKAPLSLPLVVGMGGMVYSLVDAFSHSKDETGGFSIGKFLTEFFLGSGGGILGTLGKAASWGWMGAKIGAMFGGVGAVPGMLVGAALGALVGSTDSRDEQGNFSWSKFFKNLAVGNDAAGGLANGGKQFLKWGLVGGAFGGPIGFLLAGSIGGLLGVVGADGFKKLYQMGEASGQTVSKFFKWEKGSFAYKAATCGAANSIPYLGAFVFGALGSILDLGSMLIKGLWGWVKSFLPQSVIDRIEGNESEYEKKFNEQNKVEVKATELDADSHGGVYEREHRMNVNEKDATYINEAKTENEKLKRYREIEAKNNRKKHWGTEATKGINGKKYDQEKYIALKEKWAEEDKKINDVYSHEIDVPWTAPGIKDFNTTPDNAQQYKDLYEINPDDALKFAKGVFDKQEEERKKREAERESALKKIEVGSSPEDLKMDAARKSSSTQAATAAKLASNNQMDNTEERLGIGSSPEDLKMDACRKSSCVPAMMAAKMGVGDDDDEPEIVDIRESSGSVPIEPKKEEKKLKFDYGKLNSQFTETEAKYNESTAPTAPNKKDDKKLKFDYGKLNSKFIETEAKYNEATTPMGAQKKDDKKLKFDYAKYNQQALAIPAGAEFGVTPITKENYNPPQATMLGKPTSVPAAAKASDSAAKKQDGSGTPSQPQASSSPAADSTMPVTQQDASGNTQQPSGQLNWIENLISQTIQGAFKVGGAIVGAVKTAYNNAQQANNGGPGGSSDGAVGSWGGGFSNAEYLPGKPGAASLGTHFITAKPKDPGNRPGRNNNPLNVKLHKKGTDKADEGGHRIFGNVDDGIRGNFWQLQRYINGTYQNGKFGQLNTARKIIPVWAPSSDGNHPDQYLAHLQKYGVDIDAPIDLNSPSSLEPLAKLMAGMAREEGWGIINPEEIKKVLTYGNHQGAPGTSQAVNGGDVAAPTTAPEKVRNYLAIMGRNAQGARYDNDLRNKKGYYDCSSFTARSLADAGIFPRSLVDGRNAPTTSDLPTHLARYGFKFHPYNFRGVKTAPPELQPGDILTANKAQTGGSMGHVVTYWGDNKIIAAHRKNTNPEVGIKPFYTSKQGGYWRYSPGGGSNPDDLFNKTGQTTKENTILPDSAKTPSLFKKLKKTLGEAKFSWPTISSKVNSDYGTRDPSQFTGAKGQISRTHGGVDIQAAEGDPVYSTMSGTVVGTDPDYGTIEVQHPNGWLSKYLHLGKFIARAGEQVKSGQIIGEAGGVGKGGQTDAFNPHLHFELIKGKTKIPPLQMVAAAGIDKPTKKEQLDNSNAAGYGGPDFTPRINKQMNEYLDSKAVGGPEESAKLDNRIIAELKKLQVIMMGVMKAAGKPSIAVAAPSPSDGANNNPKNQAVDAGGFDSSSDTMFDQIGAMLPNINIATTGLGTSIA